MFGRCAAAAAQIAGTGFQKFYPPFAEVFRPHGKDGLAVLEVGHTGVGQDADGAGAVFCQSFDDGHEFFWPQRAVDPDDVCAHGIEENGGRLRVGTRYGAPVLAVGKLTEYRNIAGIFGGKQSGAHFLNVDAGFDDEIIGTGFGKGLRLCEEVIIGFIKGQIT